MTGKQSKDCFSRPDPYIHILQMSDFDEKKEDFLQEAKKIFLNQRVQCTTNADRLRAKL